MPLVVVCAVAAFHAIVSHEAYCQLLLGRDVISRDAAHIHNALSALEASAKLTLGACLAYLATTIGIWLLRTLLASWSD